MPAEPAGPDVLTSGPNARDEVRSFDAFYASEVAGLVCLAAGLCGRASAEDIAQEAMLVTYRRWHKVGRRDRREAFARRVCANLAVSAFRRHLVEVRVLVRLTDRSWAGLRAEGEADDAFWGQVASLPRRQAQVIALR